MEQAGNLRRALFAVFLSDSDDEDSEITHLGKTVGRIGISLGYTHTRIHAGLRMGWTMTDHTAKMESLPRVSICC